MVFALLGTTKKRARKGGGDYQKVDYGLTKLLLDASTQVSPSPSFVYLSAVGVSEETKNSYMKARAQVESALQDTELKRLIARPSFILGDRDEYRLGESLGAPILDGALAAFSILGAKRLTEKYRSMSGQDLAQGLVELALSGAQGIVHVPEIQAATQRFKESIL
jgi:uncharacterized protein YbjT (DUF2867 family)